MKYKCPKLKKALSLIHVNSENQERIFALGHKIGHNLSKDQVEYIQRAFYGCGRANEFYRITGLSEYDFIDLVVKYDKKLWGVF